MAGQSTPRGRASSVPEPPAIARAEAGLVLVDALTADAHTFFEHPDKPSNIRNPFVEARRLKPSQSKKHAICLVSVIARMSTGTPQLATAFRTMSTRELRNGKIITLQPHNAHRRQPRRFRPAHGSCALWEPLRTWGEGAQRTSCLVIFIFACDRFLAKIESVYVCRMQRKVLA